MVSPLIFLLLIHQTWAPWRPTSISHLIIFLKSVTYYREISVIKLEGRKKKPCIVWEIFIGHFFLNLEEVGKSCRCALRRCFFTLFLSQTSVYLQYSSVTLSGTSNHITTSSDIGAVSPHDTTGNCNQLFFKHCVNIYCLVYSLELRDVL